MPLHTHTLSILATTTPTHYTEAAERRPVYNLDCYCFVSGLSLSLCSWGIEKDDNDVCRVFPLLLLYIYSQ